MKILLTGADGQAGWELRRSLALLGEVHATNRATLDLSDAAAIRRLMRKLEPALVVNAAAYTAVDKAESEESLAFAINAEAPGVLAEEAARLGAGLVHYSTDYVFDGRKQGAYVEDDPTNPLGVYGRSKLAGENAVTANLQNFLILRTSWVYALRGENFALKMLKLGQKRDHLRVVADQFGAPTPAGLIADATALILNKVGVPTLPVGHKWPKTGLYHLCSAGRTSWHQFAVAVLNWQARTLGRPAPTIDAITTDQYPTAAMRPANSCLDLQKLTRDFKLSLPAWERAFELYFSEARSLGF